MGAKVCGKEAFLSTTLGCIIYESLIYESLQGGGMTSVTWPLGIHILPAPVPEEVSQKHHLMLVYKGVKQRQKGQGAQY